MNRKLSGIFLLALLATSSLNALAAMSYTPVNVHGNLGFHFIGTKSKEGAATNSTHTTLSLNANSYIWRPWFATYNIGGTSSVTKSNSPLKSSGLNVLSSNADFSLLPRSRYPFRLNFNWGNDVDEWGLTDLNWINLGERKTWQLNARQSYITLKGDRYDAWYTRSVRSFAGADLTNDIVGAKAKTRGRYQNLYANATYQQKSNSLTSNKNKNVIASLTHNYFPTGQFYIKTLLSKTHYDDDSTVDPTSVFNNRVTDRDQLSSFMYWRPEYRPYTMTGGLRVYRRDASIADFDSHTQVGIDANLAGNYIITRRLRFTATASGNVLHTNDTTDSRNMNVGGILSYRSDKVIYRNFNYNWYASSGIGNRVNVEYQDTEYSQSLNAGVGHSANRVWVTGNRSTLRINLTQSAREFINTKPTDTSLNISHSASLNWNEELRSGRFFTQLLVLDSRTFDDNNFDSQIINYQFSRIVPINRLSQWGAHLSLQSSRRHNEGDGVGFAEGFVTTGTGRLNYQHVRLFGIYKLKFRARADVSTTGNRNGEDRRQADVETRLGYNIGKLSTALIGRGVVSNTGLSTLVVVMQLNRSF